MNALQKVFANLSEAEALAVYNAVAQVVVNEEGRDDIEDPYDESDRDTFKGLKEVAAVVERGDAVFAQLADWAEAQG